MAINLITYVTPDLEFRKESVGNLLIKLLEEGATIPFIARYRKECLEFGLKFKIESISNLEKVSIWGNRKRKRPDILKFEEEQDKLTEELKERFNCQDFTALEEYLFTY